MERGVSGRYPGSRLKSIAFPGEPSGVCDEPFSAYRCGGSTGMAAELNRAPVSRLTKATENRLGT
jgi:hypothetical protein